MRRKDNKRKRRFSLRTSLVTLVFFCWLVPVLLVGIAGSFLASQEMYQRVSSIASSSVHNSTDNIRVILNQAMYDSFDSTYVPTVKTAYTNYLRQGNVNTFVNTVQGFLEEKYSRQQEYRAVMLIFPEFLEQPQAMVYVYNRTRSTTSDIAYYQHFLESEAAAAALARSETLGTGIDFIWADERLFLLRNMRNTGGDLSAYCVMAMEIDMDMLRAGMDTHTWLRGAEIRLNGLVLPLAGEVPDDLEWPAAEQDSAYTLRQKDILVLWGDLSTDRFVLQYHALADLSTLLADSGPTRMLLLVLGLMTLPLMLVVFLFFHRKITLPINSINDVSKLIEEGDFGVQVDTAQLGSEEFIYLGERFNAMSRRLEEQFERLYREELALRDAKIKALQSQINPHFLGNTLEIINWEARLAGNVKVSAMLESLSTMLSAAMDRRHRQVIHLSEELMYARAYLHIIGERLGKRLSVEQDIDPALLDWYVPRLILQPVIENAVEHGTGHGQYKHVIIRAIYEDENWMRLEVENNSPLTEEDAANIAKLLGPQTEETAAGNIGIRNVNQRLRILYGPKSGLTIHTAENGHTVSIMRIRNTDLKPETEADA